MMCLRLILAGSTEVTSALRQRKYHILPLFYFCAVLVLYPMSDSKRHTRERSLSGDFDVNVLSVFSSSPRGSSLTSRFGFSSPILKTSILSTMPLPASLGGRKTPSEPQSTCLRASSDAPRSSQAARRDQNRIAQREFRLRKQQRVMVSSSLPFGQTIN